MQNIYVVGGGFMGSGIAQNAITVGFDVTLYDVSEDALRNAAAGIDRMLGKLVDKGKMAPEAKAGALARLTTASTLDGTAGADLVVEAATENPEVKKAIFRQLSDRCGGDCVLATNTSSIPLAELAASIRGPHRLIGTHFFSPVPLMALLELVVGITTSSDTLAKARAFGERLGKTCIVSKDSPAFIVNRMLLPMMNEAVGLLEAGIGTIEDIDAGARLGLNHPMGPLELIDMTGADVALSALETLRAETGNPGYRPAMLLRNMVRMGWLGKKAGKGFYVYQPDGTKQPNPDLL